MSDGIQMVLNERTILYFSLESNANHRLEMGFFVHKAITSAIGRKECVAAWDIVCDTMRLLV
jgi:hypothetical protein